MMLALAVGAVQVLALLVGLLGRWLALRARADLVRAAAALPVGAEVASGAGEAWTVRRTATGGPR